METDTIIVIVVGALCVLGGVGIIGKLYCCLKRIKKTKAKDLGTYDLERGNNDLKETGNTFQPTTPFKADEFCHFKNFNENKLQRFHNFIGTKGGNPGEKESANNSGNETHQNMKPMEVNSSSSNPCTPEKDSKRSKFTVRAEVHTSSPHKRNDGKKEYARKLSFGNDTDDEVVGTNTNDSSMSDADIDIVKDCIDVQTINKKLKEKKALNDAKFVCAFPSCSSAYTRKLKLQHHLSQKHGLGRDDQIRFYSCISEGSIDLSPSKPGPKTYVPPRFGCPTKNCTSIFSRKYDLQKHLRKCDASLLGSSEIMSMKDSVMQHCKTCDAIIKGGHLAEHRIKCMAKKEFETGKIKIKNRAERCKNDIIYICENDQVGQATKDTDDASLASSKQSMNPYTKK